MPCVNNITIVYVYLYKVNKMLIFSLPLNTQLVVNVPAEDAVDQFLHISTTTPNLDQH